MCRRRLTVEEFRQSAGEHWGIANQLHWVRDGAFAMEHRRARTGNAAANLSVAPPTALNLPSRETSRSVGIKAQRKRAG